MVEKPGNIYCGRFFFSDHEVKEFYKKSAEREIRHYLRTLSHVFEVCCPLAPLMAENNAPKPHNQLFLCKDNHSMNDILILILFFHYILT